jgi:hypothetical protein
MLAYHFALVVSALTFSPGAASTGGWDARGRDYRIFVDGRGVRLSTGARLEWIGAAGGVDGMERLPGVVNRYIGPRENWREGLPTFAKLRHRDAWPGVDIVYYGSDRRLEMDLVLAPGADLSRVELLVHGGRASLVPDGSVRVQTAGGEVELRVPDVYQMDGGRRRKVSAHYVLRGGRVGFAVGKYDKKRPLVIDPVVAYSSYFGGAGDDFAYGAALDNTGALYITGLTSSTDLPMPSPSPAPPYNGLTGGSDAFIAKIAPGGNTLLYVTYLGGTGDDQGKGIAVDGAHNAYVIGYTSSADFPTAQAVQGSYGDGGQDAFVAMLGPTGTLAYSTYLGGDGFDDGSAIAVDSTGAAYAAGDCSGPFPSPSPQTPASVDAFLVKLGPRPLDGVTPPALVYTRLLGGADVDAALGVAVDGSGAAYLTGFTLSDDFPLCQNGPCASPSPALMRPGMVDSFITKINAAGSQLVYSRLIGGSNDDIGRGVAVEAGGAAYLVGLTNSADFPTVNAFQPTFLSMNASENDAFAMKISPSGGSVMYSTYLGGGADDEASSVSIDPSGAIYIGGSTFSTDFPVTATAVMSTLPNAGGSAFVVRLNTQGNGLAWGTYFGGSDNASSVLALASDGAANTYAAGFTNASDMLQLNQVTTRHTGQEGFVIELSPGPEPPLPAFITPPSAPAHTNTAVTITGANFVSGATVTFDGTDCLNVVVVNAETITCTTPSHAEGMVTVTVTNPDAQKGSLSFTFDPPMGPTLTGLNPTSGTVSGGTRVTITGARIAAGATVTFAGLPAITTSVIDSTRISVTTPPHAEGAVDVVVSNGTDGSGNPLTATLTKAYTYVVAPGDSPSITSITPNAGPVEGGTHVTILGNQFVTGASVAFGPSPAPSITVLDTQTILAVTPPGSPGPTDVIVSNPNSRSATLLGGFTYGTSAATLSVVKVTPASGATSGGDRVTVLGANFTTGASVSFGGSDGTDLKLVDATQLTVTTPAHIGGAVDVVVRTLDGQQARLAGGFTYVSGASSSDCKCTLGARDGGSGWGWLLLLALILWRRWRRAELSEAR